MEESRRISIGPNVIIRSKKTQYHVWSPVARKDLLLSSDEMAFLLKFSGGQAVNALWTELVQMQALVKPDSANNRAELDAYLLLEKFIAYGLLVDEVLLKHDQIGLLHFSGYSSSSLHFYDTYFGPNGDVRLHDLPHFEFLQGLMYGRLDNDALATLWDDMIRMGDPTLSSEEVIDLRELRIKDLIHLYDEYQQAKNPQEKMLDNSFQVCRRGDGDLALLGDVELVCLAMLLRLDLRVQILRPAEFLGVLMENPTEYFGTMRDNVPYQSIFYQKEELIRGRRPDLYQRLQKVDSNDLQGKAILDLGCNIGMNCQLAVENGASRATGIDLAEHVTVARRLNSFFGAPCRFLARDLNEEVNNIDEHDTVFCFALLGHLRSIDAVMRSIRNAKAKTVYLETHCEIQMQGDLEEFLQNPAFSRIDFVGYSLDNVYRKKYTRQFYRCIVAE